jgi:hypothetical protein
MSELIGEPLVEDKRLWVVAEKIGVMFPDLPKFGYDFITWIQEPLIFDEVDGKEAILPRVAVLAVISPHPKDKDRQRMSKLAMWYADWEREEWLAKNGPDPLIKFYKTLVPPHLESLRNSQELID